MIRGSLFDDSDERCPLWAEELKRFSSPEFVAQSVDNLLHEFEVRVLAHPIADIDRGRRRLDTLHAWLRAGNRIGANQDAWFEWAAAAKASGAIGPTDTFLLQCAALRVSDRLPLENRVRSLWPSVPVELLLRGINASEILRELLRNCDPLGDLWTDETRLNLARDLLSRQVASEALFEAISRMAQTFFSVTARPGVPADLAEQWYEVRHIPDLSSQWKLRFAQQIFTTPPQTAQERFLEEVRHCIRSLAPTASGVLLSALGSLLSPGSSNKRADDA
jgi:hypothetical protein